MKMKKTGLGARFPCAPSWIHQSDEINPGGYSFAIVYHFKGLEQWGYIRYCRFNAYEVLI